MGEGMGSRVYLTWSEGKRTERRLVAGIRHPPVTTDIREGSSQDQELVEDELAAPGIAPSSIQLASTVARTFLM